VVLVLVVGCGSKAIDEVPRCAPAAGPELVVTTTDYAVGALATVDLETGCVSDRLSSRLGGDAIAVVTDDLVAVVLRSDGDVIRLYEPGAWDEPIHEIAVEAGSIIHDVAIVEDRLFATPYERPEIDVYDLVSETWLTGIDLSDHADSDGIPEADRIQKSDDGLLVALQRLNRNDDWSAEQGLLLTLDPTLLEVSTDVAVGPNPKVFGDRVLTGVYGELDGALSGLDGEIYLTEADEGFDFALHGERDGLEVLAGSAMDGEARIRCFDGIWTDGQQSDAWVSDLVMIGGGHAILATRSGWHPDANPGLLTLDVATCEFVGDPVELALEPYSLALVE